MITRRTITALILLLLALPHAALAMGTEATLRELITAAETEVVATAAWQRADSIVRQRLREEAVRQKIITTVQSRFDPMQLEVDRKVDEVVDRALGRVGNKTISAANKERIRELFKEEWYRYMFLNKFSAIESPYLSAKGSEDIGAERILSNSYRGEKLVENEIGEVLEEINQRMGGAVDSHGIEDMKQEIFKQFNLLR